MSTALATIDPATGATVAERRKAWTPTKNELAIIKSMNPKASNENLAILLNIAAYSGLNPIKRQLCMFVTKSKDKDSGRYLETVHIYTTLDGCRVIAHRSGRLDGIFGLELADAEGNWYSCLPAHIEIPYAARCKVRVKGCSEIFERTVYWSEFGAPGAKYYEDGNPKTNWAKMPRHMLLKVAEKHALTAAFPDDLGDLLTDDEVQANPEWAAQVKTQTPTVVVTESHEPAKKPSRPAREEKAAETPAQSQPQAQAEQDQPRSGRVSYLLQLLNRLESDSGDISWSRFRTTASTIPGVEIPAGKGEVDLASLPSIQLEELIAAYEEIAQEEADFTLSEGSDDDGLFQDGEK